MVIICRDIGCFMLALVYLENLMGDIQYKMWFSIRVRERYPPPPSVFLSTSRLFHFFFCSWTKIVFSVRKCKNLPEMVIISSDVGCFMLTLFYLENVMGDIQYKIWFSIRVRGGILPHSFRIFLYTFFLYFFFLNWIEIVSFVRKCKNLA